MKNLKILKSLLIIMLSVVFTLTFSKITLAATSSDDDDDFFSTLQDESEEEEEPEDSGFLDLTGNTNTSGNTSNNIALTTNNSNTNNSTTNNTTYNRSVSNTNSLANTGIADMNGAVVLVVIICGVSAVYSYKKISDYKKI